MPNFFKFKTLYFSMIEFKGGKTFVRGEPMPKFL